MEVSPTEAVTKKESVKTKTKKEDKPVTHLTNRSVKKVVEIENPATIKSESFIM